MTSRAFILALAAAAVASGLAGCGKLGNLEQPAPMFGEAAKAKYAAERAARAARAADTNRPSATGSNRENIDPATNNDTSLRAPIQGTNPNPFGGPSGRGFPGSGPGGL